MISVIVPVYNVEQYLCDCVQSVISQTYTDWECILVDDGSTDGSLALCRQFEAADPRVRVLTQPNQGVSAARNTGLDAARGDYIAFLDSDDVLHPEYLAVLYSGIRLPEVLISQCYFQEFSGALPAAMEQPPTSRSFSEYPRQEALVRLNRPSLTMEEVLLVIPCAKLYHRSLFAEVRFPVGIRHEDEYVAHQLAWLTPKLAQNTAPLYFYRQHGNSFMGDEKKGLAHLVFFEALNHRVDFYAQAAPELVCGAVHHILREAGSFYEVYLFSRDPAQREKLPWLRQVYRRKYRQYFSRLTVGEKLKGGLFLACPGLYCLFSIVKRRVRSEQ